MIKMKNLWSLLVIMMAALSCIGISSCGSDDDDEPTKPQEDVGYKDDSGEDYTPLILGQWYYITTGKAQSSEGELKSVSLYLLTFNADGTWSNIRRSRLSNDNYVKTIPGIDFDGTFTLETNNIVTTLKSGNKYYTYNFSTVALKQQDILRVVVKRDGDSDVENEEYQRFKYSTIDEALNQYIAQTRIK